MKMQSRHLAAAALSMLGVLNAAELIFDNGFEAGDLTGFRCSGNCPTVIDSPVSDGHYAGSFDLMRSMDTTYRTEVTVEGKAGTFEWNTEYWVGFSFRFEDWPADKDMEIAPFQIHPTPSSWDPACNLGSQIHTGPVMMAVRNDEMLIYTYGGVVQWRAPLVRKQWMNIVLRFIPSTGDSGLVEMWKDGKQIVSVSGTNSPKLDKCEKPLKPPYWKMGIYKWNWRNHTTDSNRRWLLIDQFKIAKGTDGLALVSP